MANCYDLTGANISCNDNSCIGSDCNAGDHTGGNEVGSINFGSDVASWGLEGLWHMSQDEFNDWFENYLPWGDTLPGYTDPDAPNPQLIGSGQAAYLASLFQGYNQFEELMLNTEMWENEFQMEEMFDAWNESADLILASKSNRDYAITDKKQELLASQESLQDEMDAWKNKDAIINIVKKQREDKGKTPEKGLTSGKQDELYQDAITDTLTSWYASENFKEKNFQNQAEALDQSNLATVYARVQDKNRRTAIKRAEIDTSIDKMKFSNLHAINDLRDSYEAGIYDQLAMFGSSQAFFDVDLPNYYGDTVASDSDFIDESCWTTDEDGNDIYLCG
tara:strand:+ start:1155 stop:2159 length:1005 start_codon:yes stop_codon:yes gene_type:complete